MERRNVVRGIAGNVAPPERRVGTPNPNLAVIKVGGRPEKCLLSSKERSSAIFAQLGKAMAKPGVDRARIFESASGKRVYAYSVFVEDPTKLVREDASGRKTVGRLVGGRFRATSHNGHS